MFGYEYKQQFEVTCHGIIWKNDFVKNYFQPQPCCILYLNPFRLVIVHPRHRDKSEGRETVKGIRGGGGVGFLNNLQVSGPDRGVKPRGRGRRLRPPSRGRQQSVGRAQFAGACAAKLRIWCIDRCRRIFAIVEKRKKRRLSRAQTRSVTIHWTFEFAELKAKRVQLFLLGAFVVRWGAITVSAVRFIDWNYCYWKVAILLRKLYLCNVEEV